MRRKAPLRGLATSGKARQLLLPGFSVPFLPRLLLEEKLSAKLTDEVYFPYFKSR